MYNVYGVFDKIEKEYLSIFYAKNDGLAIRQNLPALSRVRPVQDLEFYQIGTFSADSGAITSCDPRFVPEDSYKFPESKPDTSSNYPSNNDNK